MNGYRDSRSSFSGISDHSLDMGRVATFGGIEIVRNLLFTFVLLLRVLWWSRHSVLRAAVSRFTRRSKSE